MTASKFNHFAIHSFFAYSAFCVRTQENHNPDHQAIWVTMTDRTMLKIFSSLFEFSIDVIKHWDTGPKVKYVPEQRQDHPGKSHS